MKKLTLLRSFALAIFLLYINFAKSQSTFYRGADLSYVNEMEDCGVVYQENDKAKDVYGIFSDNGCNLVRIRLWHSPKWYDALNQGKRYSDLKDVTKSIARAKANNMQVLLDFHLSDNWADPSKQLVPAAWLNVVNDLPKLQDSLYNYIYNTLQSLASKDLLPDMVQIGNETNRGILLSPEDNSHWTLDWTRNAALFNKAIQAVRKVEQERGQHIEVVLHMAAPAEIKPLLDGFLSHGVVDFDVIGISYYWAWHKPTTIAQTGQIVKELKTKNPDKKVIIVETGYIWTTLSKDQASNIISEVHPQYSPASPTAQYNWLKDLTNTVKSNGGEGVVYWEPAWQSSPCYTQWGKGSHQEHATFFDFNNKLITTGGIAWMRDGKTSSVKPIMKQQPIFEINDNSVSVTLDTAVDTMVLRIFDPSGRMMKSLSFKSVNTAKISLQGLNSGIYFITAYLSGGLAASYKVMI